MPGKSRTELRNVLMQEALIRTREGIRLAKMARALESKGRSETAELIREAARYNEMERIRLRAILDAHDGYA